jgi:hypothetical protein
MNTQRIFPAAVLAMTLSVPVWASDVRLPNTFEAGERARASEVNANFNAVKSAVDDNDERITELESRVGQTGRISHL